jgi:N-acetylmuramoyl-L-alanine amidase
LPAIVACLTLVACLPLLAARAAEPPPRVEVRVLGRDPVLLAARVLDGVRYVSSLELLSALGVEGEWHAARGELRAQVGRTPLLVRAGSRTIEYGERRFKLAAAPRQIGDTLLVPEDFIGPLRAAFIMNAPPTVAPLPAGTALRTVVIDPGHGGDDLGAEGPGGLLEKDVTLGVARLLAILLRAELGCRVVLTRDSDRSVSLPERTAISIREDGDLFVSLHANASPSPSVTGYETFILSATASDAEATRLAEFENAAGAANTGPPPTSFLQQTLQDLMLAESMEESARLATLVQEHLGVVLKSRNRGVKQAPFWVLAGMEMPAVLVELGFMTNGAEAQRLMDPFVQVRIAGRITDAVAAFRIELDRRRGVGVKDSPPERARGGMNP